MGTLKNIGIAAFVPNGLKDAVTPANTPKGERSIGDSIYLQRSGVVLAEDSDTYPKRNDSGWW